MMDLLARSTDILDFNPASSDVRALQASLRSIESENNKFQACIAIRNKLLFQQRQSKWLFTELRQVMMEECYLYKKHEQPRLDADFDVKQWERFIDIAHCNIKMSKQCLAPLVETAEYWGMDKVHHYEWASMGRKYCKVLSSAASQNPVWGEALVKLNQLLLKRIVEGRPLRSSVNPVYLLNLEHLVAWPDKSDFERKGRKVCTLKYEPIMESELPSGYALDQYGLIVADHTRLASVACTTTVSESLDHMYDGESKFIGTTTAPPKRRSRLGCNWRLDGAMLLWCVLLAAMSWWYRRALKIELLPSILSLQAARSS